jgi:hypothetical protein
MTQSYLVGAGDFRDAAATASQAELAHLRCTDPLKARISLCVEAEGDGRAALRRFRRMTLLRLIAGVVLMVAGVVIMLAEQADRLPNWFPEYMIIPSAAAAILGMFVLTCGPVIQRWTVRRHLRDRLAEHDSWEWELPPVGVELEDSRTFQKMKIQTEDLAVVYFDVDERRLLIEGVVYRYIIQAEDVLSLRTEKSPGPLGLEIVYSAAGVQLGLTLSHDSVLSYLRAATIGGDNVMIRRAKETLRE